MGRRKPIRSIGGLGTIGVVGATGSQPVTATSEELGLTDEVRQKVREGEIKDAKDTLESNDVPCAFRRNDLPESNTTDGISLQRHYGSGNQDVATWKLSYEDDAYLAQNYLEISGRNNLSFNDASMIPDAMAISYHGGHWFSKDPSDNLITWSESDKFTLEKNLSDNWTPGSGVAVDVHLPSSYTPWPRSHRHGMETTLVHTGDDRNPIKIEYRHLGAMTSSGLDVSLPFSGFFDVNNGKEHWDRAEPLTISDIENG